MSLNDAHAKQLLDLGAASAKHTMTLHSHKEEVKDFRDTMSDDKFGAPFAGFATENALKLRQIDALFDELAARLERAEHRADVAEAHAAEEVKARERAEKIANDAADTAAKAAAAAEIAADAAGASKIKRQEAEKKARELWNKVTAAEEAKKTAEEHLMGDLQACVHSRCLCCWSLLVILPDDRKRQLMGVCARAVRGRICGRRRESAPRRT